MKRLLFLLILCCQCSPFATAFAQDEAHPFRLQSIQARFVQEKNMKILARPLVSTGSFIFEAPQSLRWQYHQPVASLLLMHKGKVRKFVGRDGTLVEEKGAQLDGMQMVLPHLSDWLNGQFSDTDMFKVASADEHRLLLKPQQQGMARVISAIDIVFSEKPGLIDAIILHEGSDSTTTITFSNRTLNEDIADEVFTSK